MAATSSSVPVPLKRSTGGLVIVLVDPELEPDDVELEPDDPELESDDDVEPEPDADVELEPDDA